MVMKIPRIGDRVITTKKSKISIKNKAQNVTFLKSLAKKNKEAWDPGIENYTYELKKGTELIIDRVYIRNGESSGFDSVTFRVKDSDYLPNGRFFLPIDIANNLQVKFVDNKENKKKLTLKQYFNQKHPGTREQFNHIYKIQKQQIVESHINVNIQELLLLANEIFLDEVKRCLGDRNIDIAFENAFELLNKSIASLPSHSIHKQMPENQLKKLEMANRSIESVCDHYEDFNSFRRLTIRLQRIESEDERIEISNSYVFDYIAYKDTENYLLEAKEFVSMLELLLVIIEAPEPLRKYRNTVKDKISEIRELLGNDFQTYQLLDSRGETFYRSYRTTIGTPIDGEPIPNDYIPYESLKHITLLSPKSTLARNESGITADIDGKEISLVRLKDIFQKSKKENKKCNIK